jgi:sarcosine oxidase gamma subunit
MSDLSPIPLEPLPDLTANGLTLSDISFVPKWRVFSGYHDIGPGTSQKLSERLVWSVRPGEWSVVGPGPDGEVVDLTHVRAMFRLTGEYSRRVLAKICALDLSDDMFPDGGAVRTLVAGVATELVRDDQHGTHSYLILPSRSFERYMHTVLVDAGGEFGLS